MSILNKLLEATDYSMDHYHMDHRTKLGKHLQSKGHDDVSTTRPDKYHDQLVISHHNGELHAHLHNLKSDTVTRIRPIATVTQSYKDFVGE